jgi:hypothetical protein
VNLSQSGAAHSPAIVTGPDDTVHAFWWDQFDGLMLADGSLLASPVPSTTEEIQTIQAAWSRPRSVPAPVTGTPRLIANALGHIHAFWLGDATGAAEAQTDAGPLMHSRLTADRLAWSSATVIAEAAVGFDVTEDGSGTLHLAYVQALHTSSSQAGIYYQRSEGDGVNWTSPTALYLSRYMRSLSPEIAHVDLVADDAGNTYVTWDDPRLGQAILAYSPDRGATWEQPQPAGDTGGTTQGGRLAKIPGGETLLLWQDGQAGEACNLRQAPASEILKDGTSIGQQVLAELAACPTDVRFLPLGEGQILMVTGSGSDSLTLAAWDGERWSEPSQLSFGFQDPDLRKWVYLSNLQAALVRHPSEPEERSGEQVLIAVGTDQQGDVWATNSQTSVLDIVFAPPPPWSVPTNLPVGETLPDLPTIAADADGRVHLLWSQGTPAADAETALFYTYWDGSLGARQTEPRWSQPLNVLQSPQGGAEEPSLVIVDDRLHAVWSGGPNGEILYSNAFVRDAYGAEGWSEPRRLPAPVPIGSRPHITSDTEGTLHVVYAVPVNEGRGIYYTRKDKDSDWSPARQIFDAAEAGWTMADYPRVAVGIQGTLHVVWVRAAFAAGGLPQGIYYAHSFDRGETWSEPLTVAEGAYGWPQLVASSLGQVHLLWNETAEQHALWHRWSTDGGLEWTRPERIPGVTDISGPAATLEDENGALHLVGLDQDDAGAPALLCSSWDGQHWNAPEVSRLKSETIEPGLAAVLSPIKKRLSVILRGERPGAAGNPEKDLWYTERAVPELVVNPAPTVVPRPTIAPSSTPAPTATPSPTPSFGSTLPTNAGASEGLSIPLLLAGGLGGLLVFGALAARKLWSNRR